MNGRQRYGGAVALVLLMAGCGRPTGPQAAQASAKPEVRITQFYAEPEVPQGEQARLCYGVENAKTVQLEPPVERVWPAVARCFAVDPAKSRSYKLTAADGEGHAVTARVEIRIGPPRAKILEVSISKTEVRAGEPVTLCYKAANATGVEAGPGRWITTRRNDAGCLADAPRKTTTYHVRITGGGGQTDAEQVTVRVRP